MSQEGEEVKVEKQSSLLSQGIEFLKTCDRTWLFLVIAGIFAVGLAFWPLLKELPFMWLGTGAWEFRTGDGYYSHGLLVPIIAGYIIYQRWPLIKDKEVKPGWFALLPLLMTLWVLWAANATDIQQIRSYALIAAFMSIIWFVAGWKWMWALSPGVLYLLFALPIWTGFIDNYTNSLQIYSTKVSFLILQAAGYHPFDAGPTSILLDSFDLNVAVPCSGLKLVVAVTAFTVFFMLIARLRWWANGLMLTAILPLCLFINGLRIALIGIVGEENGRTAGLEFHDYSGYITLVVCFFLLFKFARLLGWKD